MEKVALVTGCSSGIGYTTALDLARKGYFTYASVRNLDSGQILQTEAQKENLNLKIIEIDITKEETIKKAINEIELEKGRIDVLVNNAGYGMMGSIEDLSIDEIKEALETDFFGHVRMIKSVIPMMRKNGGGRIINISSISGKMGFGFSSPYTCSKFALEGLSECIRMELMPFGIITTIIEPGVVKTKFHEKMKFASNSKNSQHYGKIMESMSKQSKKLFEMGIDPKEVSQKIIESIDTKNPQVRYTVGPDSSLMMEERRRKSDLEFEKYMNEMFSALMSNP